MKKITTAALLMGAIGASAFAQGTGGFDPTPYGFGFRIGAAFPTDGALRDVDNNWVSLGIDYNIDVSILRTGNSFLSVDMVSRNFGGGGGTIWNLMLGNRFYGNASAGGYNMYFIAGIGAVAVDIDTETEYKFGGVFGAGLELGPHLYAEGRFTISEKANGVNPGFFGLYLGYKF